MVCHRSSGVMHHCEGMEDTEALTEDDSANHISAVDPMSKCPMNCCSQFGSSGNALVAVDRSEFVAVDAEYSRQPVSVVFTSNGFSSHTDRGPPSLA